jgi:hypothetical protein
MTRQLGVLYLSSPFIGWSQSQVDVNKAQVELDQASGAVEEAQKKLRDAILRRAEALRKLAAAAQAEADKLTALAGSAPEATPVAISTGSAAAAAPEIGPPERPVTVSALVAAAPQQPVTAAPPTAPVAAKPDAPPAPKPAPLAAPEPDPPKPAPPKPAPPKPAPPKPAPPDESFDDRGEVARAMVGIEQVGASSSDSVRKFFFDFYVSRSLPFQSGDGAHRWWGSVRIGSQAIQTAPAISITSADLVGAARRLNLNTIAQAAEFQGGYEYQFKRFGLRTAMDDRKHRTALGWVLGGGAALPFNPVSSGATFDFPSRSSFAFGRLREQVPNIDVLVPETTTPKHIVFTTPDRNNFFRNYFTGLRMSTFYNCEDCPDENANRSVGTITVTVGQNELISGGVLRGFVAQVEASYPLPLNLGGRVGNQAGVFVFGRAAFRLNSAHQITPLFLNQPTGVVDIPTTPLIARPSRRDLYTIGIGFDAIRLGRKVFGMDE